MKKKDILQSKEKKIREIKNKNIYLEQVSENERKTNRTVVIVSFAFVVMLVFLEIGVAIDYSQMLDVFTHYYLFPVCVIMIILDAIAFFFRFSKPWIKYMLVAGIMLQCAIGFFVLTTYGFYLVFLPLILVIKYFDKKFTIQVTIISELLFVLCCILNYYLKDKYSSVFLFHEAAGYNSWNRIIDIIVYIFVPATILIVFCGAYGVSVTNSGKKLIKQYAENETKMALVNAELNMAAEIQKSALPEEKFTTPDEHFSILAKEIPAKEVGGDFYDYFMLDDYTLAILIADVSDKGVPAAMFMMSAKKAIRCAAECCHSLSETIVLANKLICQDNKSGMFLTMWLGLIDTKSGIGKYTNAGHLNPIIKKHDGKVFLIENEPDLFIGNFPKFSPRVNCFSMGEGDTLILYTDGITDAMNEEGISYGLENVIKTIEKLPNDNEKLLNSILNREREYMGSNEQFDDMTMLTLKCNRLEKWQTVTLLEKANPQATKKYIDTVEEMLIKLSCPDYVRRNVETVIDEICTNIVDYAYEDREGDMRLDISAGHNFIQLVFSDKGVAFNPLGVNEPEMTGEPQIGGLGIFLVKNLMDSMDYKFTDGKNVLTTRIIWNV